MREVKSRPNGTTGGLGDASCGGKHQDDLRLSDSSWHGAAENEASEIPLPKPIESR